MSLGDFLDDIVDTGKHVLDALRNVADALERVHITYSSDGSFQVDIGDPDVLRDFTYYDRKDKFDWVKYTNIVDNSGHIVGQVGLYDNRNTWEADYSNGLRKELTVFDFGAEDRWETKVTAYDSKGRADVYGIEWDNRTEQVTDYDQAHTKAWETTVTVYDRHDRRDSMTVDYDNDTMRFTDYDQSRSPAWDTKVTIYENHGRADTYAITYDNKERDVTDYDAGNAYSWRTTVTEYDGRGRADTYEIKYDNGAWTFKDYDQSDVAAWDTKVTYADAQGRTTQEVIRNDNGSTLNTQHDVVGTQPWNRVEVLTAATGEKFTLTTTGSSQTIVYGSAGSDQLVMSLSGPSDQGTLSLLGDDLAKVLLKPSTPYGKAVEVLLTIGAYVLKEWLTAGEPGSSHDPATAPQPPSSIPGDSKFFFGAADGTKYFLTKTGQLWEVAPDGDTRLSTTIPNSTVGTDAWGGCSWRAINPTTESAQALAYQEQVTGVPSNLECVANGVKFDGYDYASGTYLEAKGTGYANKYDAAGDPLSWYENTGHAATVKQLGEQVRAAGGRMVEWHVAEQRFAQILTELVGDTPNLIGHVVIKWTPPK